MPGTGKKIFSIWNALVLLVLIIFSGLLWLNSHVGYEAKSALLVKSSMKDTDDVQAKTVAAFAETDTFVTRTLGSTTLQNGPIGYLETADQEKKIQKVKVRGGKQGGLVMVHSSDLDSEVAEVMSTESTETLVRMTRLYLGDTEELSIIVIDKAIVSKTLLSPVFYTLKTGATALVLFIVITLLRPLWKWVLTKIKRVWNGTGQDKDEAQEEPVKEILDQRFVPQKLDPTFLYPEKETGTHETHYQPKASEMVKAEVFGEAPKNSLQSVSVAMEDLPFTFEDSLDEPAFGGAIEQTKNDMAPAPEEEPTVLEYKRRLNELLAQK